MVFFRYFFGPFSDIDFGLISDLFWMVFAGPNLMYFHVFLEIQFLAKKVRFFNSTHPSYEKAWFLEVWVDFGGPKNQPKHQKVRSRPSQNAIYKKQVNFWYSLKTV